MPLAPGNYELVTRPTNTNIDPPSSRSSQSTTGKRSTWTSSFRRPDQSTITRRSALAVRRVVGQSFSLISERFTERLILVPIGPEHADELWLLHQDPVVAYWYGGAWSRAEATTFAEYCGRAWEIDGVCKWIARDRASGQLVGRGGLSRMVANAAETVRIRALVADAAWGRERLELGWALFSVFHGQGLATELGHAGLRFAFEDLGASAVIAYTERCNLASRRVMERLSLQLLGEIQASGLVEGHDEVQDDAPFTVYATQ